MTVGQRMKQLRIDHKISQREMCKRLGYTSTSIVSCYESGKRRIPYEVIVKVSEIFGVTPNYLMGYTEKSINEAKLESMGFTEENLNKLTPSDLNKIEAYLQALLDSKK